MRLITSLFLAAFLLPAQTGDEKDALAVVQKVFDAIAAHDSEMMLATMLPDARVYSVRANGTSSSRTGAEMATQVGASKGVSLERFTSAPKVLIRGNMAQVWGEYEFLRDGKVTNCGVDTASLFKTPAGWKVAALAYNVETTGCKGQ